MATRPDPVMYLTATGKPVYRAHRAPAHLATRSQLRTARLSAAGLEPAAWLHTMPYHTISPLFDRRDARPIRPLTPRQRAALAAGRALVGTLPCALCGRRVHQMRDELCSDCQHDYEPGGGHRPWPRWINTPDTECRTGGHEWGPWVPHRLVHTPRDGRQYADVRRCRRCWHEQSRPDSGGPRRRTVTP